MRFECAIGKIRYILGQADRFLTQKISEEGLPILVNHIPLFYILPEDKSHLLFNEVVDRWKISKSSLSDIITKYQGIDIVEKRECILDKRSVYVSLTEKGLEVRASLKRYETEFLDKMLEGISVEERVVLEGILDKAVKNMGYCKSCE